MTKKMTTTMMIFSEQRKSESHIGERKLLSKLRLLLHEQLQQSLLQMLLQKLLPSKKRSA